MKKLLFTFLFAAIGLQGRALDQVDGVYQIGSAQDLIDFASLVNSGTGDANAVLTADIDMNGKGWTPIGQDQKDYKGHFNGQGHRILNLTTSASYSNQALFGQAVGGAIIENVIIDASCTIQGVDYTAGILGHVWGDGVIVRNCGNEANINGSGANSAGIVGCSEKVVYISNCYNTGEIYGDRECAGICAWMGSDNSTISNCYSTVTVSKGNQLWRKDAVSGTNMYHINGGQSSTSFTSEELSNGALCYEMNGDQSSVVWYQTIGTDSHPVPFSTGGHSQVYANGVLKCDGTSAGGDLEYNNSNESTIPPHTYSIPSTGFCTVCGAYEANALTATDGWYEISQPWQLRWMAESVNEHNSSYGNANIKLTDDIDYSDYTDQAAMFGKPSNTFKGVFDGQNHTVTIALVNNSAEETGLFRRINSGTVKNLKVAGTIETNKKLAGGICSGIWQTGTITNCESAVTITDSGSGDATHGGILACVHDIVNIKVQNCLFSGTLNASGRNGNAGIVGWTDNNNNVKVKNCLVTGTLTIADVNSNGVIVRSSCDGENNYYTCSASSNLKKDYATEASAKKGTGELCYLLNEETSGGTNWTQTIGTDDNPVPFNTPSVVYANGEYQCDGVTPKAGGTTTYSNTEERTVDPHSFGANNLCSGCRAVGQAPSTSDSKYQIGTIGHLVWFSNYVNSGNTTANAVLTADIDQELSSGVYAVYEPIGNEDNVYTGHFDGQGHTVNLHINNGTKLYQGLFGTVTDGVYIEKVIVTGSVTGKSYVGGIVGGTKGGSSNARKTNIWYCGNEATITATDANAGGILGVNMLGESAIILTNCYNTGTITGARESGALSGWLGGGFSSVRNCYNAGTVTNAPTKAFSRNSGCYFTNCYYTATSGTDNSTENHDNGQPSEVEDDDVASGLLCAKLGYGFRQNLGEGGDEKPNFNVDHGFVSQIGTAGYSTMYNIHSDVTIPDGVEAYAGVINGDEWLHLDPITEKIKSSEPVILKLAEGTEAGFFNFMPTTGASAAESNDLKGSTGSVTGGDGIYALAKKSDVVGFYPVESTVTIPEGRAYLKKSGGSGVKGFTFVFDDDDATGINSPLLTSPEEEGQVYNLAGQRISKLQKGINIVNGRKVLF